MERAKSNEKIETVILQNNIVTEQDKMIFLIKYNLFIKKVELYLPCLFV